MIKFKNYREQSKMEWGIRGENIPLTESQITLGCMLRIADALDEMKEPYIDMIENLKSRDAQVKWYRDALEKSNHREAGLKGYITKLKNLRKAK